MEPNTSTVVRGRTGVRHLRSAELTAVRQIAASAAFGLNHGGGHGGDLLSPEFSPQPTRPIPARRTPLRHDPSPSPRPAKVGGLAPGRVIPLRPDLAGWTRPLVGGEPLHLLPGRGRHHRPEAPVRLTLAGYTHPTPTTAPANDLTSTTTDTKRPFAITAPPPAPALAAALASAQTPGMTATDTERPFAISTAPAPTPARQPRRWPRIRRCASRVRAYVSHPAGDLAPLALAIRTYLAQGVR
ncbi:hypothetical protein [Nocardiopsis protaetiae]|uniref:hypothetical protein n=1 Tax=Nocardiopsis protaetiae TaxID=3382270 RepID=UPI00387B3EB5